MTTLGTAKGTQAITHSVYITTATTAPKLGELLK